MKGLVCLFLQMKQHCFGFKQTPLDSLTWLQTRRFGRVHEFTTILPSLL